MAVHHYTTRTDDFGSAGEATEVRFALNGVEYVIDLNKRNKETFERRLAQYIEHGRAVEEPSEAAKIRQWAQDNGHQINDRGRIPLQIQEAYRAAQ